MSRSPAAARAAIVLALIAAPAARGQSSDCNAETKEPVVQLDLPGRPFEPTISTDGCWLFVTLTQADDAAGPGVAVVRRAGGTLSVVRRVSLQGSPTGAVLTHDQKLLIVADGGYLAFLDAPRL
ncbi:MAG TPA: hypothetical protein VJW73_04560, partial [Gemmatimonadaceae bacterium]|nr:hypothetical protein [Gemmatimonadaceae bacterium]